NAFGSGTANVTLVVGDFSGTDSVRVTTPFNQFQTTAEPVIVNASGTFDISGSTLTQTISALDIRGGSVRTGTNILQTNGTVTGLAASTIGSTVTSATLTGNWLLGAGTTVNVADTGSTPGLVIPAVISGNQSLTKGGAGTLLLNGVVANT